MFEKWLEPRFYASVLAVNVPSMSRPTGSPNHDSPSVTSLSQHISRSRLFELLVSFTTHHWPSSRYLALSRIPPSSLCTIFKNNLWKEKEEERGGQGIRTVHANTSGRKIGSSWTENDGREREKTEKRQLAFDVLTERARRRRRSRLFRNDDAPASRIAEGLHCASAARASSTQPPRASSSLLRNRRSNTFAQPRVRVPGSLEYGWGARMRMRAPTCVARVSIARSLCIVPPPFSSFFLFFRHFFSSYFSSAIVPLSLSHSFVFFPLSRFPFERREDDGRFDGRVRERTNPIMNYTRYV